MLHEEIGLLWIDTSEKHLSIKITDAASYYANYIASDPTVARIKSSDLTIIRQLTKGVTKIEIIQQTIPAMFIWIKKE